MPAKSKIYLLFCLSFIFGIYAGSIFSVKALLALSIIVVAVLALSLSNQRIFLAGFLALVFIIGAVRFSMKNVPERIAEFAGKTVSMEAVVVDERSETEKGAYLTLGRLAVNGENVPGKIQAFVDQYPIYDYGDRLFLEGKVALPESLRGDFSYRDYLKKSGIDATMSFPKIISFEKERQKDYKYHLFGFKKIFSLSLDSALPEPHSSFLQGLLLGSRKKIPQRVKDNFIITGTSHLVAISGFNISIIVTALTSALKGLGRRACLIVIALGLAAFVILTGGTASVIRAAVMGSLALLASNFGRLSVITNAMATSAVIMLWVNPLVLKFDLGFQLSFLALIGLVYMSPKLSDKFDSAPKFFHDYLFPTLSAQIFTLPLILGNFSRLSVVAPLSNLLVLPLIPPAMLLGFLAGAVNLVVPHAAFVFVWPAWGVLTFIIKAIDLTALIPFASIEIAIPKWWLLIYYILLARFVFTNLKPQTVYDAKK
jgi:competence protein ComEC